MWYKIANTGAVPSEPGTTSIPNGMVRRFHVTKAPPEVIRSQGILQSHAKGFEGPKAIYSWPEWKDAKSYSGGNAPIVEFYTDPKKLESPYAQYGDIPPNQIIAIHEPWHEKFRYCLERGVSDEIMRNTGDPEYARAADELKKIRQIKTADRDFWRNGYLSKGHSWTQLDSDPHDETKAKIPPPNPNDAIWVWKNGQLLVETAGEWFAKGNRGFSFTHDDIYGEEFGGSAKSMLVKGRFDADKNVVSVVKTQEQQRISSILYKNLLQRFPRAKIIEY